MGSKGYYLSKTTIIFVSLAVIAVAALIGVLCGILPDCIKPEPIEATNPPKTEPPIITELPPIPPKEIWEDLRLPTALIPHHYDLKLRTDLTKFIFNGSVDILFNCTEATNYIILHSKQLDIVPGSASLSRVGEDDSAPDVKEPWFYEANQYMVVELMEDLVAGEMYTFYIAFGAQLKEDLLGFYLSSYTSGEEKRYIATTFFAPTDARKCFPCFDEPAMKANFTLTMENEPQYHALANMPQEYNMTLGDDWLQTKFQMSVPMSTYLLCFVVSDFVMKSNVTKSGVVMGLWARPDAIGGVDYALQKGVEQLDFYDEYFGTKFPLPKMDMIAIPDFTAGAMENWGLITYRETALIYEEGISSASNKQRVCSIVAHELAHQWFGNLVTLKWWDDTWLNEGFASYVEYLGAEASEPDWGMTDQFVARDLQGVLVTDSLASSRPISIPVSTPEEINQQFDSISYNKGASIIRMLSFFLGEETFRKGLSNYLAYYAYKNAENNDLWVFLTAAAKEDGVDVDVKEVMDTWTLQMGYPQVKIARQYGGMDSGFVANQTRFLLDPEANATTEYGDLGYQWKVPVNFITEAQPDPDTFDLQWIDPSKELSVSIPGLDDNEWLLVNYNERGYYRVNYDAHNWNLLTEQLVTDHENITIASRSALLSDAFNLARSGNLNQTTALDLTLYLTEEREYVPWLTVSSVTGYIDVMLSRSAAYGAFNKYMLQQVTPLYEYVGWDDVGSHLDKRLRSIAISFACGYGNEDCTAYAVDQYSDWMNTTVNNINAEFRYYVYCTAIAAGGQDEWFFALEQYQSTTSSTEQSNLRSAMACANEPWILSTYLEYSKNPDLIRGQDAVGVITSVASNTVGAPLAWDYFRANWDYLREAYGDAIFTFSDLVEGVTSHFNTEFSLMELTKFMEENPDQGTASRTFIQMVEATQANIRWMEYYYDDVEKWLLTAV